MIMRFDKLYINIKMKLDSFGIAQKEIMTNNLVNNKVEIKLKK